MLSLFLCTRNTADALKEHYTNNNNNARKRILFEKKTKNCRLCSKLN